MAVHRANLFKTLSMPVGESNVPRIENQPVLYKEMVHPMKEHVRISRFGKFERVWVCTKVQVFTSGEYYTPFFWQGYHICLYRMKDMIFSIS